MHYTQAASLFRPDREDFDYTEGEGAKKKCPCISPKAGKYDAKSAEGFITEQHGA
jgi:hypothetical protein